MTRVDITRASALVEAALFPAPFALMLVYMIWKALNGGISAVVLGLPAGFPEWSRWLILVGLVAATSYGCWRWATVKQVTLVDDQLSIRSLAASARVLLSQVESIQWTQRPNDNDTAEAMIVLCVTTTVGRHIRFEPKSAEVFEILRAKIEAASVP